MMSTKVDDMIEEVTMAAAVIRIDGYSVEACLVAIHAAERCSMILVVADGSLVRLVLTINLVAIHTLHLQLIDERGDFQADPVSRNRAASIGQVLV